MYGVGGMVARICMFTLLVIGSCCGVHSLWLTIRMVTARASSLAAIRAQWMASRVVLWPMECARPIPSHLEECACPREPNIIS